MVEKACGCIIMNDDKVLLIKQNQGFWGFPKGHVEEGETEEETALREVKEETNIDVLIEDQKRYETQYTLPNGNTKKVVFFVAKKIGGEEKKQEDELLDLKWCTSKEALELLTYEDIKKLFKKVLKEKNKKM